MSVGRCRGQLLTVIVLVMQTDAPFWDSLVFDGIDEVDIEAVTAAVGTVEVMARGRAVGAACPDCGRFSDRVHDRYQRRLKDLPLAPPPKRRPFSDRRRQRVPQVHCIG
ncbi:MULTISPECIES: transposase family protein [unclassified Streptomyces]|uniref:transposase family protein n=1 Tax=unclassified Streptomyces TaxID=2593676 RepID=UPI002DD7DD3B|nr:transposase family protein [Streptomyces sp. NBC_01257]WRZ62374.1 hypothetical protein OG408_00040 [Streptomyces sp. NBC_01257]